MDILELFNMYQLGNPNLKLLVHIVPKVTEKEAYRIADSLNWDAGWKFLSFVREYNLISDIRPKFSERYHIIPNTIARKRPKQNPIDFKGIADSMFREVH